MCDKNSEFLNNNKRIKRNDIFDKCLFTCIICTIIKTFVQVEYSSYCHHVYRFGLVPPPSGFRVRKEVRTLSEQEWNDFVGVIKTMYEVKAALSLCSFLYTIKLYFLFYPLSRFWFYRRLCSFDRLLSQWYKRLQNTGLISFNWSVMHFWLNSKNFNRSF